MKNIFLFLSISILLISCKEDKKTTIDTPITTAVKSNTITKKVNCNGVDYVYEFPQFNTSKEAQEILNDELFSLIVEDFTSVTYERDTPFNDVLELFKTQRKQELCNGDKEGLKRITVEHVSENEKILSFELSYETGENKRKMLRSFYKTDLSPVYLADLALEGKASDVQRIFDINMQQSVADAAKDIKPENDAAFRDHVRNTVFKLDDGDINTVPIGLKENDKGEFIIQMPKNVKYPSQFKELYQDVIVEIKANEMPNYLDLSKIL